MLKTLKRKIALVAVAAIGASGLALVAAPSANAAVGVAQAGTVSPVRVSFTGTTADVVPAATLTFTNNGAATLVKAAANDATIVLSQAPTTSAAVSVTLPGGGVISDTLGGASTNIANADTVLAGNVAAGASVTASISISANAAAGTYKGQIVIDDAAGTNTVTVNFDFTTTGAPASYTLTQASTSTLLQGVDTATLTLLDGAGKTTQPGNFDSIALTTTAGTVVDSVVGGNGDASLSAAELAKGVATILFTAANVASTTTVTTTPGGVLPGQGLGAKTLSYTVTGTILATALTAMTVSVPAGAVLVANVVAGQSNTAAVPAGTSAVTVGFTGTASSKYRFSLSGVAGTINGAVATTAQFVNADTDTAGKGSIALTLGGSALIEGVATTVSQVTVANAAATDDVDIVITQTLRAAAAGTVTLSPTGSIIAKLGTATAPTSTPVVVTVADQFASSAGAGYTVRAYRGTVANANLLATAVTAADGTATLAVSHATTLIAAGNETYVFTAIATGTGVFTATPTLIVAYSTDGNITGMTTTITGGGTTTLAAAAGTGITATAATAQTTYSVIEIPADGTANNVTVDGIYTVTTAAVTATGGGAYVAVGEVLTLQTNTTPDNAAVYTVSEGLFLCKTNSCAWDAGLKTATISDITNVFVFGTKTGIGTVTITSGGLTREVKVFVKNAATNFYTLSATPATASVAGGSYGIITVSVKDVFGNAVDTGQTDISITADGAVLLGGMAASTTTGTGSAGTATATYIGNNTGGTGTVAIAGVPTTGAWAVGFVKPTGAGDPVKSASVALTVTPAAAATDTATAAIKTDVATANAAVKTLATQVTVLQASVATLIDSLTTQIAALLQSVSALTKAVAKLQAKKK